MISPRWKTWPDGWKNLRIDISRTTILPANFDGCGGKTRGKRRIFNGFDVFHTERERERKLYFISITKNPLYKLWDSCFFGGIGTVAELSLKRRRRRRRLGMARVKSA